MRTLKFRYWNTITKEMVNNPKMPYKENWTIKQLFEDRGWVWMQFTGLTDRHGVEIYEGDVVALVHKKRGVSNTKAIVWDEEVAAYDWEDANEHSWPDSFSGFIDEYEVIGNVYENPELLGAEL